MRYTVYIVGPEIGLPCKIGVAQNLHKRLGCLQSAHWEELFIHYGVLVRSKRTAFMLEKLFMKRLAEDRIRGEWFNVFSDKASKVLEDLYSEIKESLNHKGNKETRWPANSVR